jgi:hypothetical protein
MSLATTPSEQVPATVSATVDLRVSRRCNGRIYIPNLPSDVLAIVSTGGQSIMSLIYRELGIQKSDPSPLLFPRGWPCFSWEPQMGVGNAGTPNLAAARMPIDGILVRLYSASRPQKRHRFFKLDKQTPMCILPPQRLLLGPSDEPQTTKNRVSTA